MKVSKVTPDPLRDPPKGYGEYQCPGQVIIMPARSYGDIRFTRKIKKGSPVAFRVLAVLCSHQNEKRGNTCFVGQETIARVVGTSEGKISGYIKNLIDWGYVEKKRNSDPRRPIGHRGNVYRVILDPSIDYDKQMADTTEIDDNKVQETLKKVYKPKHYERELTEKQEKLSYVIAKKYAKDNPDYSFEKIYNDVALWILGVQTDETWVALDNKMASPHKLGYFNKPPEKTKEPVNKEVMSKDEEMWRVRLQNWKPGDLWSSSWGSPPNEKNHNIPLEYYNKYYHEGNKSHDHDGNVRYDHEGNIKDTDMTVKVIEDGKHDREGNTNITVKVMHNNNNIYNNIYNKEILINGIINSYMNVVRQVYGSEWKATENDKAIADQLLQLGYSTEQFKDLATKVVSQTLQDNKQPPQSLQYFLENGASL